MTIIYLHGFASAGNGAKARALRARFGEAAVLSPDLPIDPREVRTSVDALVQAAATPRVVLVGTSLGGFYAAYFAQRWGLPCVLVNPGTNPHETVGRRIGMHRNLSTGALFEVRAEFAPVWQDMEREIAERLDDSLVSLFLAEDDDVVPYAKAAERWRGAAFLCVTPDGGHRYEAHWPRVVERVGQVVGAA